MTFLSRQHMRISSLHRLRFILTTIFLFGGKLFLERARLLRLVPIRVRVLAFFSKRYRRERLLFPRGRSKTFSPPVLRELLETLGPTFVKLGQILSLRADVVGEELSRELAKLQSDVAPFPFDQVRQIVQEEFGLAPAEVFSGFNEQPVAAASLAQVHHAYLKDGTEVAVKVQRPDIRKTIEQDIYLLHYLARLAERFIPEVRPFNAVRLVQEFADWTLRELDFVAEGHNAERFRVAFEHNLHIKIPRVYWNFTTPRVLTLEYVEGVRADDFNGIEEQGLDRRKLALYGVEAQLQQYLIDGFFHADPHPGNSFALTGDVLCFYDFGMVGYLNEKQRRELTSCFLAFANRDIETFVKHFLHLTTLTDKSEVARFEKDASDILSEIFFSPTNPSVAWVFFRLINRGAARHIMFPADLALFGKSIITTEAMGLALYPDFDFNEHLVPIVRKAFEAYLDPAYLQRSLAIDIIDYIDLFRDLPRRAQSILRKFEEGSSVGVRLDPQDAFFLIRELRRQSDRRLAEMCLLALLVLLVVLALTVPRSVMAGYSIVSIGAGFFLALFFLLLFKSRH